jgi:hypothetical protein
MKSNRFFGFSILLHALVFWGFWHWTPPRPAIDLIDLEFQNSTPGAGSDHQSHPAPSRTAADRNSRSVPSSFSKIDLGLSTTQAIVSDFSRQEAEGSHQASREIDEGREENPLDPYDGMEMPEIRFVTSLYREIDKSIINSPFLSEYGHTGKVYLNFEVDPTGSLIESSLRAQADDPVLKVIASRAIRKALANQNGELALPRKKMSILTQFTWSDYQTCNHLRGGRKNQMSFCNYAEDKRKNFSTGERTATYLGALRYGFDAIDEIKKYRREEMHRKTQFNPFEEYERDPDWNLGS